VNIFSSSSYSYFDTNIYDPLASTTNIYEIPSGFVLNITTPNTLIVFSRLTGNPLSAATVTISHTSDASTTKRIFIGELGDISVIK